MRARARDASRPRAVITFSGSLRLPSTYIAVEIGRGVRARERESV